MFAFRRSSSRNRRRGKTQVRLLEYGADRIRYEVELPEPALLVETEFFFEGWTARLDDGRERIAPARVNGIWRSWPLPAGRHRMTAEFGFPGFAGDGSGQRGRVALVGPPPPAQGPEIRARIAASLVTVQSMGTERFPASPFPETERESDSPREPDMRRAWPMSAHEEEEDRERLEAAERSWPTSSSSSTERTRSSADPRIAGLEGRLGILGAFAGSCAASPAEAKRRPPPRRRKPPGRPGRRPSSRPSATTSSASRSSTGTSASSARSSSCRTSPPPGTGSSTSRRRFRATRARLRDPAEARERLRGLAPRPGR